MKNELYFDKHWVRNFSGNRKQTEKRGSLQVLQLWPDADTNTSASKEKETTESTDTRVLSRLSTAFPKLAIGLTLAHKQAHTHAQ